MSESFSRRHYQYRLQDTHKTRIAGQRVMQLFEIEKKSVVRYAHSVFTILTAMDVAGEP